VIAYFDTSAVLPLIIDEPASQLAGRLWDDSDRVATVRLVYPEARAALAQANRLGRLNSRQLRFAVGSLDRLIPQLDVIEISETLAKRAGQLAEQMALRGYDAVHLAGVEAIGDADTILVAGDHHLCQAAQRLDLNVAQI
jgi:uncharacterized protein